jgi:hypothetical protein
MIPGAGGAIEASDNGGVLACTNTLADQLVTIPNTLTGNLLPGFNVTLIQLGSGSTSLAVTGSDVLLGATNTATMQQGGVARLKLISVSSGKIGTWSLEIDGSSAIYNDAAFTFTGPWDTTPATNIYLMLDQDNRVTMILDGVTAPINAAISNVNIVATVAIPERFIPTERINGLLTTLYDLNSGRVGTVFIETDGFISVSSDDDFSSNWLRTDPGNNVGYYTTTLSWLLT